jgi:hypothetical protein
MHGTYLVAAVGDSGMVRVAVSETPVRILSDWRRRKGGFTPVVLARVERDELPDSVLGLLPTTDLDSAARFLGDYGVAVEATSILTNSIRQQGQQGVAILNEWNDAVARHRRLDPGGIEAKRDSSNHVGVVV